MEYESMNAHHKRCYNEGYIIGLNNMATTACDWRSNTASSDAWWAGYSAGRKEYMQGRI